ncbi:hypothetical protein PZ938_15305 [Luteipulveratus sp. YIM 133132]|uniref:Uncharacterized protein n=1 Tax=Luteipulveratus flavus TaxID=3031728 RepID=A0ABT6C3U7_9MICO|nr:MULTISPECIES: hypothetical protein [unclassified Luteipulveratus]MDE9366982.1 hypothetical protein [Luteipulveratus sp. YIM 133132]MDF8262967.1 hypothetical protein [Luteipulveratus sp. YIM 133296]
MDSSNHWYRHAHIWSQYCGLGFDYPPRINGVIQHGWTFVHGFGAGHEPPHGFTKYVWADVNRRRGQAVGWRDYYVTGAPMLYLDRITPHEPDAPEPEGTIWYPFHGTVDYEAVSGDHDRLIDEIKETETGPVTMCLYYVEYEIPAVRAKYEDAGFRVISHGTRGVKWTGGNPRFLSEQLGELRRHRRIASNRLSSAIFYGSSLGLQPAVYGDPMDLVGVKTGFNGTDLLEHTYPELHGRDIDARVAREVADVELGRDAMLSPEEMVLVLGWEQEWLMRREESA